jgi:hypothetical protein
MDTDKTRENEILQTAVEALRNYLPTNAQIALKREDFDLGRRADWLVHLVVEGKEITYDAEVKANVTRVANVLLMIHREGFRHPLLLVTKYINGQMADQLKKDGVNFIDTYGNAFINRPPIYIFVKGNRPQATIPPARLNRAFRPVGLRMIYAFLRNPTFVNKTYRQIAVEVDAGLGTVDWVMRELKQLGYLVEIGQKGHRLIKKKDLFQRWITEYPEQLKPKLLLGRYTGDPDWWTGKMLDPHQVQWGGEIAAARLTKYLRPQIITIYTNPDYLNRLLIDNRLRKDINGDVEVLERFWRFEGDTNFDDIVHPILIYADLIATGNQRNIDTAKIVYDKYITQLIHED